MNQQQLIPNQVNDNNIDYPQEHHQSYLILKLSRDALRYELFSPVGANFSSEEKSFIDDWIGQSIHHLATHNYSNNKRLVIFIDGMCFSTISSIEKFIHIAEKELLDWRVVEVRREEELCRKAIDSSKETHQAKDRNYDLVKNSFQSVYMEELSALDRFLIVENTTSLDLHSIVDWLLKKKP